MLCSVDAQTRMTKRQSPQIVVAMDLTQV